MFKTDKESLEELSFSLGENDIANFKAILEHLKSKDLLTISAEEAQKALEGLEEIGKLKLDGKVYGFHIYDSFAALQSPGFPSYAEGVELFLRQGDSLRMCFASDDRDHVASVENAVKYLKKQKIPTICTGEIPFKSEFLGVPYECDEDDPLTRYILNDDEIEEFESEDIQVIKLDSLI